MTIHHKDQARALESIVSGTPIVPSPRLKTKGRSKTDPARSLDLTHKLLTSKGQAVLEKIIQIALEDGNPNQMQALKMCIDRIAPTSFFENLSKAQTGKAVNIQVNVVQPERDSGEVVDVEMVEVADGKS